MKRSPETLDRQDRKDSKDLMDRLDRQEKMDDVVTRVELDQKVRPERQATKDILDLQEPAVVAVKVVSET